MERPHRVFLARGVYRPPSDGPAQVCQCKTGLLQYLPPRRSFNALKLYHLTLSMNENIA